MTIKKIKFNLSKVFQFNTYKKNKKSLPKFARKGPIKLIRMTNIQIMAQKGKAIYYILFYKISIQINLYK